MSELRKFLAANRDSVINYIGKIERYSPAGDDVFSRLVKEILVRQFSIEKNGVQSVVDKVHVELAWAILETMWLGCLSQQKAKRKNNQGRPVYPEDCPIIFKNMLDVAFEIGREYGEVRP
jgi:hypothetical protein